MSSSPSKPKLFEIQFTPRKKTLLPLIAMTVLSIAGVLEIVRSRHAHQQLVRRELIEILRNPPSANDGGRETSPDSLLRCMRLAHLGLIDDFKDIENYPDICQQVFTETGLGGIATCVGQAQGGPHQCVVTLGDPDNPLSLELARQQCDDPYTREQLQITCRPRP